MASERVLTGLMQKPIAESRPLKAFGEAALCHRRPGRIFCRMKIHMGVSGRPAGSSRGEQPCRIPPCKRRSFVSGMRSVPVCVFFMTAPAAGATPSSGSVNAPDIGPEPAPWARTGAPDIGRTAAIAGIGAGRERDSVFGTIGTDSLVI